MGAGWIGCDAALDRSPVDGRYLPLAVSDLSEDTLAPLSLGILQAMEGMRLAVVETELAGGGGTAPSGGE